MRHLTTRTLLGGFTYPAMCVAWVEDEDGLGWKGRAKIWLDSGTHAEGSNDIEIRQTTPLGSISAYVDPISHGAWASTRFEGTVLTERDLQWAAAWAAVEIKRKREALGI